MIQLCDTKDCTGCLACYNACNFNAIKLIENEEGFIYPKINFENCISCSKCMRSCPVLQSDNKNIDLSNIPKVYAVNSKDKKLLKSSASGGFFSTIASSLLTKGWIVYGAAFSENMKLTHIRVSTLKELRRLQGSKYIQSYIGDIYKEVKKDLLEEKNVLFSGTPCQIAGLKYFLGNKTFNNLFLIDIICHGVPSQKIFDEYCKKITSEEVSNFVFRSTETTHFNSKIQTSKHITKLRFTTKDCYTRAYLKSYLHRKSCYTCKFSCIPRQGDISIGDFWSIIMGKIQFSQNSMHGISCVLINTKKGKELFDNNNGMFHFEEKKLEEAILFNHNIIESDKLPFEREYIYNDFFNLSISEVTKKYSLLEERPSFINQIKIRLKYLANRLRNE